MEHQEEIEKIYNKAKKEGINLINIPIRHLGTEKAHDLYKALENYLEENGVNMLFETTVQDLIIEDNVIKGVKTLNNKTNEKVDYYV